MFRIYTTDKGNVLPMEYLEAAPGDYEAGQLLTVTDGKLAAINAAEKTTPPYLCMGKHTVAEGELLPVTRVAEDAIYETTLSAEAAAAVVGTKLQVSAGGLQADAAAAGTFEAVYLEDTAAESIVRGRFV